MNRDQLREQLIWQHCVLEARQEVESWLTGEAYEWEAWAPWEEGPRTTFDQIETLLPRSLRITDPRTAVIPLGDGCYLYPRE